MHRLDPTLPVDSLLALPLLVCARWWRRVPWALAGMVCALVLAEAAGNLPGTGDNAAPAASEYEQKARIVITLAKLARWNDDVLGPASAPFQLCTLGKDPFGTAWEAYERSTVHGHPLRTRRANVDELDGCAAVFIAQSEATRMRRYLQVLANAPVLTVSEIDGFVDAGGMVELLMDGNKVRFKLDRCLGRPGTRPYLPTSTIHSAQNYDVPCK